MSLLCVYPDDLVASEPHAYQRYDAFDDIVRIASEAGIRFERWTADRPLAPDASPADILAAYEGAVARLKAERGFVTQDVIRVQANAPNRAELRKKFLSEHTHSEDEARFFVEGAGLFCIHHERRVYALLCERSDLINVPAGTRHWFDMGPEPSFTAIRMFNDPSGWVAAFTGADIAERFPRFDALHAPSP